MVADKSVLLLPLLVFLSGDVPLFCGEPNVHHPYFWLYPC
jgi:hypothetical protein